MPQQRKRRNQDGRLGSLNVWELERHLQSGHQHRRRRSGGGGRGAGMGPLQRQAKRDVKLAYEPYLDALVREKRTAKDEMQEGLARTNRTYDILGQELAPIWPQYQQQAQTIASDFTNQIGNLGGMLGINPEANTLAQAEGGTVTNALGSIGATGLGLLASDASRQAGYQAGTQRYAAAERAAVRKNYLEDYEDLIESLRREKLDMKRDWGPQITQRLDELRQRRFEKNMQQQELDVAKQQFRKTFGLEKEQVDRANRQDRRAWRWVNDRINETIDRVEDNKKDQDKGRGRAPDYAENVLHSDYSGRYRDPRGSGTAPLPGDRSSEPTAPPQTVVEKAILRAEEELGTTIYTGGYNSDRYFIKQYTASGSLVNKDVTELVRRYMRRAQTGRRRRRR